MQRIPADARLPSTYDDKEIGYRVLTIGRGEFVPFTTEAVTLSMPRCWSVAGGVDAPDQGGYIVWGLADKDLAETSIEPDCPNVADGIVSAMRNLLADAIARITAVMPATPVVQMDTGGFEKGVNRLRSDMTALVLAGSTQQAERVSAIQTRLSELSTSYASLKVLDDASRQVSALTAMRDRLSEVLGDKPTAIQLVQEDNTAHMATVLETVRADIDKLSSDVATGKQASTRKDRSLQALDMFLQKVGG